MNSLDSLYISCTKAIFGTNIRTVKDADNAYNMSMKIDRNEALLLLPNLMMARLQIKATDSQVRVADLQGSIAESLGKVTALQLAPDASVTNQLSAQTKALYQAFTQLSTLVATINTKVATNETVVATELTEAKNLFTMIKANFEKIEGVFQLLADDEIITKI